MGTMTIKSILPPAQKTSYREQVEIEQIRARVPSISKHIENYRKEKKNRGLITVKMSMYVHSMDYILYNGH